jgi:hypothetical protein
LATKNKRIIHMMVVSKCIIEGARLAGDGLIRDGRA